MMDFASIINTGIVQNSDVRNQGTSKEYTDISSEAMNKILYDILASDEGLAKLSVGENASGGFGSSSKTLLAQDLITKAAGEIAKAKSPKVIESDTYKDSADPLNKMFLGGGSAMGKDSMSVICTHLAREQLIPLDLYSRGHSHFLSLSPYTVSGYRVWGVPVAAKLPKFPRLTVFFQQIVYSRYLHITGDKKNLVGAITVWVGQPVCNLIGRILSGVFHGRKY